MMDTREVAENIVDDILIHLGNVSWGVGGALECMNNEAYDDLEEALIKIAEKRINDGKEAEATT